MMTMMMTLFRIAAVALFALSGKVRAASFSDCLSCLDLLPDAFVCMIGDDGCFPDLTGFGTDALDFEAGNCTSCMEPVFECMDLCTPPCLETTAKAMVDCMVTPECYGPCIFHNESMHEFPECPEFPMMGEPPECTFDEFLQDIAVCSLPDFPSCEEVQANYVTPSCEAMECCSVCQDPIVEQFECFYNWMSDSTCSFTCPAAGGQSTALTSKPAFFTQAALEERTQDFQEACRQTLVQDLMQKPEQAMNDYMNCIASNTNALVTDDAQQSQLNADGINGQGTSGAVSYLHTMAIYFLTAALGWTIL